MLSCISLTTLEECNEGGTAVLAGYPHEYEHSEIEYLLDFNRLDNVESVVAVL